MITLGIVGSGQLGWMMIMEGRKLGIHFNVLGNSQYDPASRIADQYFGPEEYRDFLAKSDFVTYEFEHVDRNILKEAEIQGKLFPSLFAVDLKKDRSREKEFLSSIGVPEARFRIASDFDEAVSFAEEFPKAVIKQCFEGYDGKGQAVVENGQVISNSEVKGKCVVEEFIDYEFEASIICYRSKKGETGMYTPSMNFNSHGMLVLNEAPIEDYGMSDNALKILSALDYIGIMGIEFFIKDGKAMVNEISPRVHNSGHHTLMGTSTSQFEQHVRLVTGLPVSEPVLYTPSGIVNLVGSIDDSKIRKILEIDGTTAYIYGKSQRRRRKLGHINVTGDTKELLHSRIEEIKNMLYGRELDETFLP